MKSAFGQYGLIIIAIFFIFLFAVYLSVSVGYGRSFQVKAEVINIIERNGGVDNETLIEINEYLRDVGYATTSKCNTTKDSLPWIAYNTNSTGEVFSREMYCIAEIEVAPSSAQVPAKSYYHVKTFYKMEIPILSSIFNFSIEGTSKIIVNPVG